MLVALATRLLLGAGMGDAAAKRFAPAAGIALAVVAVLSLGGIAATGFRVWLHFHDRAVIAADRQAAAAKVTAAELAAERAANAADAPRQAKIEGDDAQTRKAIDDASARNPEAAHAAAGPSVNAAADSLRRRQAGTHPPPG